RDRPAHLRPLGDPVALNNDATLVVKTGRFYIAPVGTEAPTNLTAPGEPWEELGHTSVEDILSWATEGGEATTLGSLQSPSLRTTSSPRTESLPRPCSSGMRRPCRST